MTALLTFTLDTLHLVGVRWCQFHGPAPVINMLTSSGIRQPAEALTSGYFRFFHGEGTKTRLLLL